MYHRLNYDSTYTHVLINTTKTKYSDFCYVLSQLLVQLMSLIVIAFPILEALYQLMLCLY